MANGDALNFAMAVLQIKAQRERDKAARAQEQETMERERELFRLQKQKLELELQRSEAQRQGLAELTTSYLALQKARTVDQDKTTGGGWIEGPAGRVEVKGVPVADRALQDFQETYMRVAATSPEAVALYAQGFKDFDTTLIPAGMGTAGGPSLDARKKAMDLLFDGYKVLEKELAPETPDVVRKRGEDAIKNTQTQTADLGRAISQQIDLLGLGLSSEKDVQAAAGQLDSASKGPSAGTSLMDTLSIDMQSKIVTFASQAQKIVKPGTYQEEVFQALQKNMEQLGTATSFMVKQRQQVEREAFAIQQKLEYGGLIYQDKVAAGADNFLAAREATRETNELFATLSGVARQLNLDDVFVKAKQAGATEEQTAAALDLIQSKVAQLVGPRDLAKARRVNDILAKQLFGAQAAAVQAGWQIPIATPAAPKPTTNDAVVPAPGTGPNVTGGWRKAAPKPGK